MMGGSRSGRWVVSLACVGVGVVGFATPRTADATWSVVGVDSDTQQVGVTGASCPQGLNVVVIAGLAPGFGAVASQAYVNTDARDQAVMRLGEGASPEMIISEIANSQFDNNYQWRQHGIAALGFDSASFTGTNADDWKGHQNGPTVAVQGNILYGPEVVDEAFTTFGEDPEQCPFTLADRLMVALEAGAGQGGDMRCTTEQTALSAFIRVANPGDDGNDPYLNIVIAEQQKDGVTNPVTLLREAYDQWRIENPPDDSHCGAGTGTGTTGASETGAETTGGDTTTDPGDTSASAEGGPGSGGETSGASSETGTDESGTAGESADDGCGCRSTPASLLSLGWLALALVRRRRATG